MAEILIIDDDEAVIASLDLLLKQAGHTTRAAAAPAEALAMVGHRPPSLILQDMNFSRVTSGEEGLQLLAELRAHVPAVPVILITAWGSIELAVAGMKAGAADFITKPWTHDQIVRSVSTALDLAESRASDASRPRPTRAELDARHDLDGIVGQSPALVEMLALVCRISATDAPVLLTGGSGTGKELVAAAIHRNSRRRDAPFVKVNLGGIPTSLFESEMFGHVRGAFTDAVRSREGRFAAADGGTILLDEIGDLDPRCQVKLLRVLQDRTYEPVGSSTTRRLDVRVVAATNRDLHAAVESGEFREDLLYRLNLIAVHLPPLAERLDDIPELVQHFLARAGAAHGREGVALAPSALGWLRRQEWPGNVRQLEHLVERAVLVTDAERLEASDFEQVIAREAGEATGGIDRALPPVGSMTMDEVEKAMIEKSIEHFDGNLTRVARSLGLSRGALYRRLEKHGIRT